MRVIILTAATVLAAGPAVGQAVMAEKAAKDLLDACYEQQERFVGSMSCASPPAMARQIHTQCRAEEAMLRSKMPEGRARAFIASRQSDIMKGAAEWQAYRRECRNGKKLPPSQWGR